MKDLIKYQIGDPVFVYDQPNGAYGIGVCVETILTLGYVRFFAIMSGELSELISVGDTEAEDEGHIIFDSARELQDEVFLTQLKSGAETLARICGWDVNHPAIQEIREL